MNTLYIVIFTCCIWLIDDTLIATCVSINTQIFQDPFTQLYSTSHVLILKRNFKLTPHYYYLEDNNIYAEEQNGFHLNRCCAEHGFTLTTILRKRQSKRESTYVAYLDVEKAFDRVDHNLLLYKLLTNGIYGYVYKYIKNIYVHSTCSIKINEVLTNWF